MSRTGSAACLALLILPLYLRGTFFMTGRQQTIEPLLERFLQNNARAGKPLVAVFDCDGTLISGDIGESMLYHQLEHFLLRVSPARLWPDHPKRKELTNLYESLSPLPPEKAVHDRRFISFADMVLQWYFDQLAAGKTEKACSDIVKLLSGFTPREAEDIAAGTLQKERGLPRGNWTLGTATLPKGIRYFKETVELLTLLQERGYDIWVVSGSNRWSVEAVCAPLGIQPGHVIGIDLDIKKATLTDKIRKPVPVLRGKVQALQRKGVPQPLLVASDSTYDIPLFNYSLGLKVLVRSDDDQDFFSSGGIARDKQWLVIDAPSHLDGDTWPTHP